MSALSFIVLPIAAFCAGICNAIAGGGSFLTFPSLLLAGLSPRAANMTSCIGIFPGYITNGWASRSMAGGTDNLSLREIFIISVVGGALGAILLLNTSENIFAHLVPWLIMFATAVFAWGSFFKKKDAVVTQQLSRPATALGHFLVSIYGGYFGGGIGILMITTLTMAGMTAKKAGATKNILTGVINICAVIIFAFSPDIAWAQALIISVFSVAGGLVGVRVLKHINEKALRIAVTAIGTALTIGMFLR